MRNGASKCNDVTHRKRSEGLGNLKKVRRVETRHRTRRVDFRLLAEALGRCCTRWWGTDEKNQNRKIVPLSPYLEEPLNSKVMKSFVPELRSRYVFFVFRDSYVLCIYIYIYIYMNIICPFHTWPYLATVHYITLLVKYIEHMNNIQLERAESYGLEI